MDLTFQLQDKQLQIVESQATEILAGGAAGGGKAIDINELVKTQSGYVKLKDVHVGDFLYDENNNIQSVVEETDVMYGRPCYEVTFDCGAVVVCDALHLWSVFAADRTMLTVTTGDLHDMDESFYVTRFDNGIPCKTYITSVVPVESVPVKCIRVDSPSNTFQITELDIVTHNSFAMRVASIIWSLEIPGLQTYLFRRKYADLIKNHLYGDGGYYKLLAPLIDAKVCKVVGEDKIKFQNGSVIWLCHCQYEKDKYNYHGAEIHLLLIDELSTFEESIYRYLRNRVRIGGLEVPPQYVGLFPRIISGTNPGNIGHAWVKATFIDPKPPYEIWRTPKEEGGMLRQFIPARLQDNAVLMENDPDYADRLSGLGDPELVKAMLEGDWDIAQGAFFGGLWDAKKLIVPDFSLANTSWYKDRSYDYGMSHPSAVCWFAESDGSVIQGPEGKDFWMPKGSILMFREYYTCTSKPNEGTRELAYQTARRIREIEDDMPFIVHPGPADNAIFNSEYNDGKIALDMEREGISWTRADKRSGSRASGWAKLSGMLKAAIERDPERPWIMFTQSCRNTIRTLPMLPRKEGDWEDIDTNSEDHLADAIRYRITAQKQIMTIGKVSGF